MMISKSQEEIVEYYNHEYYGGDNQYCERSRRANEVFLNLLRPRKGSAFLDVGCGAGMVVNIAVERGCKATDVDISSKAIETARRRFPSLEFILANGENLPFEDNHFAYVTSLGTIEHYLNPEKGLKEILRVAKPQAKICIVLPNYYFLFNILSVAFTSDHLFGQ